VAAFFFPPQLSESVSPGLVLHAGFQMQNVTPLQFFRLVTTLGMLQG